jgi:hypothetical protein
MWLPVKLGGIPGFLAAPKPFQPHDFVLFSTIARTIGDKAVLPELQLIEKWKTLKEEKLEAAWETVTEI